MVGASGNDPDFSVLQTDVSTCFTKLPKKWKLYFLDRAVYLLTLATSQQFVERPVSYNPRKRVQEDRQPHNKQ